MIKPVNESVLNQISLTGARAIALLGLLIEKPRSIEEIRQAFLEYKLIDEKQSYDILRIDLNTLKYIGCKISRASQSNNYKYKLLKHPFLINLDKDDIKAIKKTYNAIKKDADIELLYEYHELFKKISKFILDEEIREAFLGISDLKYYDIEIVKELIHDCRHERKLELLYKKPSAKNAEKKQIYALKLVFKNDKLYLYGTDSSGEGRVLNVKRILAILKRSFNKGNVEAKVFRVKFFLKDFCADILSDEEIILKAEDNGYLVEGNYYNEFMAIQRILFFGSKCTVISPENFKTTIISKLKEMKKVYGE